MTEVMMKQPADVLDYDIDFIRWMPPLDRITGAVTTIEGGTAVVDSTDFSDTTAKVWLSGGALGDICTVKVTITTQEGRSKQFCFNLKIRECH